MRFALVLTLTFAFASAAAADDVADARAHYDRGTTHYALGEFAAAAVEYEAAYKLKPLPELLYDCAQAHRLAGNLDKALILYRNYVSLYPRETNADDVRAQIARLKERLAANPKPAPVVAPVEKPPLAEPALTQQPKIIAHRTPVYKKWWLWTIVGVAVAAGTITTAVLLTRPPSGNWANAPDVTHRALVQW